MKISTKGRYALRMLCDLAEHQREGYVPLKEIAERQNISKKYLEQIVTLLNRSDILRTGRGYQGGYKLARPANTISIAEILTITEGSLAPVSCLDCSVNDCDRKDICPTLPIWEGLRDKVAEYLENVKLSDIVGKEI